MKLRGGLQSCCWCWWGRCPSGHWGDCCPAATPLSSQGGCCHARHCHSCMYMHVPVLASPKQTVSVGRQRAYMSGMYRQTSHIFWGGCAKHSCPAMNRWQTQVAEQHVQQEGCFLWELDLAARVQLSLAARKESPLLNQYPGLDTHWTC